MATRGTAGRHISGPRFVGDPQVSRPLNTLSRRLDDTIRQAFTDDLTIQKKRGGSGARLKWVKIVGFGTGLYGIANSSLKCKDLNFSQAPVGAEFDVWILSYGDTPGQLGMVDAAKLWFPLGIGDPVRIEHMKNVPCGSAGWITGWFLHTERGRAGCA